MTYNINDNKNLERIFIGASQDFKRRFHRFSDLNFQDATDNPQALLLLLECLIEAKRIIKRAEVTPRLMDLL